MIEKANLVACGGSILMGAGNVVAGVSLFNWLNGCYFTWFATGQYALIVDMQQQLPFSCVVAAVTPIVASGVACSASIAPPTLISATSVPGGVPGLFVSEFIITTSATLGGAAVDIVGSLAVALYGIGAPGTSGL